MVHVRALIVLLVTLHIQSRHSLDPLTSHCIATALVDAAASGVKWAWDRRAALKITLLLFLLQSQFLCCGDGPRRR
jgi:hypothetical protein